jgi:hypothetical protein
MMIIKPENGMRGRLITPILVLAQLLFIQALGAQVRITPLPELSPLPLSQKLSSMREPLPVEIIADAAIEFSGASDSAAMAAKEKLAVPLRRFRDEVANVNGQTELGERALQCLHKNLFTGYSVTQTRVDTALESGIYNCVSSAVLYMIVARSVGLSVSGVRTPDHAFCSVLVNGQPVDVETTNPLGFNPGAKKEFMDSFGKVTGYNYVPPGNYSGRRTIEEKELLSLILYNRVSEYGDSHFFKDAIQPAVSAFTLIPTDDTRQLLTVAIGNYIAWLDSRQEYPLAVRFTDSVKAAFGGIIDIEKSRRDMYHNWTVSLLNARRLDEADELLAQAGAKAALDEADWMRLSVQSVQMRAQLAGDNGDYLAAASLIAEGMKRLGRQPVLLQAYEICVHNAATILFNSRKMADARAALAQGLLVYPDSRMLQEDLETVMKALKQ